MTAWDGGAGSMIGTKLNGRYEILEHLGEGATATVYKGLDARLGREVALKILLPHVRESTRKRFFQEAMAAAHLNHPNIMSIHDRGDDNDRHYLVIEYVDGLPLTSYVPSSPQVVASLGAQIARALDYAHERDIIHRDIKPANIKVTSTGQIKIMDLGLARSRDGKRVTAPGMVIGTPAYISPEQAQGLELDRHTDIYSLGIVLYEMATGQLPFNADDITALMLQHVQQPAPPPRTLAPDIPVALERVILRALEKHASRRYQTGRSMADALDAAVPQMTSTPVSPVPSVKSSSSSPTDQTQEPHKRIRQTLRLILADDHTLLRRTLANFLEQQDGFVVVAEAGDGESALTQTLALRPNVLVLDLNMPGKTGLDILPEVREKAPDVKVLVLTGREDDIYILRALRAGAHGYVLKSTDENKLVESIRKVMDDEMVLGRGVAEKVVGGLLGDRGEKQLTDTEIKILLHIAKGYENDEIGDRLNLGMTMMIETMANIMNKLGVRDRNAAALKALRRGTITLEDLHDLPPPSSD